MSEETPKISEEKNEEPVTPKITATKKEKDPKRVEAGRRLAAISKAAKERKMREIIVSESKHDSGSGDIGINYGLLFGFLGTAVAIGSLYYTRKDYERQTKKLEIIKEEVEPEPKNIEIERSIKIKTQNNHIDTFD